MPRFAHAGINATAPRHAASARPVATGVKTPETHNAMGEAFLRLGRSKRAGEHFKEALNLDPDFAEARKNLERARAIQDAAGSQ